MAVQVGDIFPAFSAPMHDGGTLDLGEFRGKKNLVRFQLLFRTDAGTSIQGMEVTKCQST
jgi:peroxiredoxin